MPAFPVSPASPRIETVTEKTTFAMKPYRSAGIRKRPRRRIRNDFMLTNYVIITATYAFAVSLAWRFEKAYWLRLHLAETINRLRYSA
jgi:hypothetical protein